MHFKEYVTSVNNNINEHPLIISHSVQFNQSSLSTASLEITILFKDGSRFFVFEFLRLIEEKVVREKYRYHYMTSNREMIFRYDNAPHHRNIVTFPDHKHIGNNVVESSAPRIIEVLKEIELMILKISLN